MGPPTVRRLLDPPHNDSLDTDQLIGEDDDIRYDYSSDESRDTMPYPITRSIMSGTRDVSMFPTSPIRTSNFNIEFDSIHPLTGEQLYRVTHHSYHDDDLLQFSPIVPPRPKPI